MRRRRPLPPEDALARVVLERYLTLRAGESLTVESWSHALPWARSFVVEARRRGAVPTLVVEDEEAYFRSLELAGAPVASGPARSPLVPASAHVYLGGPDAFARLLGLPAEEIDRIARRHEVSWWRRAGRYRTRAVRLAVADATPSAAARYGVDLHAWRSELVRASRVDPRRLEAIGARVSHRLGSARSLRVRHPNGTDLLLRRRRSPPSLDTGRPRPTAGHLWARVPSGLLIVPLEPRVAEGTWETNRPAYDRFADPPVALGGWFEFRGGRLREFTFERGGDRFGAAYALGGRRSGRPLALTVGLNPEVVRAPEVLELAAGTVGLLLGDGQPSRPPGSGIGFLAALGGASVDADGRPWIVDGALPGTNGAGRKARPGRIRPRASSRTLAPWSGHGQDSARRSARR